MVRAENFDQGVWFSSRCQIPVPVKHPSGAAETLGSGGLRGTVPGQVSTAASGAPGSARRTCERGDFLHIYCPPTDARAVGGS